MWASTPTLCSLALLSARTVRQGPCSQWRRAGRWLSALLARRQAAKGCSCAGSMCHGVVVLFVWFFSSCDYFSLQFVQKGGYMQAATPCQMRSSYGSERHLFNLLQLHFRQNASRNKLVCFLSVKPLKTRWNSLPIIVLLQKPQKDQWFFLWPSFR